MPYSTLKPLASQKPSGWSKTTPTRLDSHAVVTPIPDGFAIEVETLGSTYGARLDLGYDPILDVWTSLEVHVGLDADSGVATRLNRLLAAFTLDGLPAAKAPGLLKYWRSKSMALGVKGKKVGLPCHFVARKNKAGTGVWWSVTTASVKTYPAAPKGAATVGMAPTTTPAPIGAPEGSEAPLSEPERPAPEPKAPKAAKVALGALPEGHPGIFRSLPPKGGIDVWQHGDTKDALDVALKGHEVGDRTFVILRGPTGSGKTVSAMDLARRSGLPFWKVDVPGLRDFGDWAGYSQPTSKGGVMVMDYVPSQFAIAVDADGPYGGIRRIVMLDEITRVETAGALNALLAVLDGHGTLYVPDARRSIRIDPAVMFVATANIGSAFTGTVNLDPAFVNRATHTVLVGFPPKASESKVIRDQSGLDVETSSKLVDIAQQTRLMSEKGEIPWPVSTRQLVASAKAIMSGAEPLKAAQVAFANIYSDEGGSMSHHAKVMQSVNGVLRGYVVPSLREVPKAPATVTPVTTTTGTTTTTTL